MAIEFHEGLPGAGKSYEACVAHILPAIQSGRQVITNIRGMNHAKFAELLGESEDYVRLLLIQIEPAEADDETSNIQRCINEMCDKTPDNALVVWDEIQDYFPSGNAKLPHNQQKFWTEHRHRGLDIIIMGQDRGDVHKIIRNRIRTVIYFLKLEAVGQPDKYKWEIYQKQKFGKFEKTGSGVKSYDSKYFGLYASVRRETVQKSVYQTGRTNALKNSKGLTLGVPLVFAAAAFAIYHLWGFFHPQQLPKGGAQQVHIEEHQPQQVAQASVDPTLVNPPPPGMEVAGTSTTTTTQADTAKPAPIDYFDKMAQQYQVRLSAIMDTKKEGKETMGYVEMLDSTYHQKEKFSLDEIRALGWVVERTGYGVLLKKGTVAYVARSWPIDLYGRVDRSTSQSLARNP